MKPTVKDIAEIAGVSPATVSNALNGRKGVSREMKETVFRIAGELGYLKEKQGDRNNVRFVIFKRHGYIVSDTPFFSSLIEGIEKECRLQGYQMMISHVNLFDRDYRETISNINADLSSGLLILATEMNREDLEYFKNSRAPRVLLDNCFTNSKLDTVLISNEEAAYTAISYLIDNGHSKIGYLHSSIHINNFGFRQQGYLEAMKEHGLKAEESLTIELEPTIEGSYRDMKAALENRGLSLPTAFFADNDIIAFGAMRAMKEAGVKIPEDVSVVGFDDMPFCEITAPRLTTIKVFKQEMGSVAMRRLMQKMNENDTTIQKIQLSTELVTRGSVLKITK